MSVGHTEKESWDLLKVLRLLQDRATYPDALLDLFVGDLTNYGYCVQRVHANGRVDRINPNDIYALSDEVTP